MNKEVSKIFLAATKALALYKDMVYSIALTHTKNRHDADDVFQEVFLVYQKKQPTFDDPERRKAWLITTTLNCAKQVTSSSWQKKVVTMADDALVDKNGTTFEFSTDEQNDVFFALQQLPEKYRTALHLFYFEDLSIAKISSALQVKEGTIKVRLSRARALMREKLLDINRKEGYFDGE